MIIDMIGNLTGNQVLPQIMASPINCGAIAMLAGFIIVPVVSALTPKPDTKLVEESFANFVRNGVTDESWNSFLEQATSRM
jgi:Na+(H+)/acetate symporter ActP